MRSHAKRSTTQGLLASGFEEVLLDPFPKHQAGPMDATLHGPLGDSKNFANMVLWQVLHVKGSDSVNTVGCI